MATPLKKQVFELRFFPIAVFFDRKSELLDLLYRDPKTKKKHFEHWQFNPDWIRLFDQDESRSFQVSYQNCVYFTLRPPTDNYARDQILRYVGETVEFFGDKIDQVLRVGFRETTLFPVKAFDDLAELLVQTFVKTDSSFFQALGAPMYDLQLFPMVFKHGQNRYQITLGPTPKEQLLALWGVDSKLPDQALFLDVDYYALQPTITSDLRSYVAEFLNKERDINAKVLTDLSENILAKMK